METTAIVRRWLTAIEDRYDRGTMRHLADRGVGPGWRCLEVGAGSGSIAAWLSERVGPAGHVLATDLDLRFLGELQRPNLTVQRHDITVDPLPEQAFELVHARLVLEHLANRELALRKLAAALAIGGWLVVEENDNVSITPDPAFPGAAALHEKMRAALTAYVAARTAHPDAGTYGRRLFGSLQQLGLLDVGAEGRVYMVHGGEQRLVGTQLQYEQLGPALVATGLVAEPELREYVALLDDPRFVVMGEVMMAAWGRRAATEGVSAVRGSRRFLASPDVGGEAAGAM